MGSPHGLPPPDPAPEPVAEPVPEPVAEPVPEVAEPVPEVAEPVPEPVAEPEVDEIEEDDGDVPVSRSAALIEEALNASLTPKRSFGL